MVFIPPAITDGRDAGQRFGAKCGADIASGWRDDVRATCPTIISTRLRIPEAMRIRIHAAATTGTLPAM
jgi:hypothetical protein